MTVAAFALAAAAAPARAPAPGAAFDRIKALAGVWEGTAMSKDGPPATSTGGSGFALEVLESLASTAIELALEEVWAFWKDGKLTEKAWFFLARKK